MLLIIPVVLSKEVYDKQHRGFVPLFFFFPKVNLHVANWAICDSGLCPHEAIPLGPACLPLHY